MAKQTRNTLKGFFETGKKPTGGNYADLLDSFLLVNSENTGSIDIEGSITASGGLNISGDITASGNISASGTIFADTFESHGGTEIGVSDSLNVTGGITASNISSSGFVSASAFSGDGSGLTNISASSLSIQQITASYLSGSIQVTGSLTYTSGSTNVLYGIQSSGSIIPDSSSAWDLGGPDNVWRDLFLSEDSIRFVSRSGEVTRFRQEDARRLKEGQPPKLGTAIAGFNSIYRPQAIMSAINQIDYQKWTVEGRIGTFLSGELFVDVYNKDANNYISLGKSSDMSTSIGIMGNITASGTISSSGRISASGGFETDNSASFGHISASGNLKVDDTGSFAFISSSGDLKVDGFASFGGFGNVQSMTSTTSVPANTNMLLYGPITLGTSATLDIAVGSQVLVKDLLNA